jgi:hypothetical protein
LSDTSKYGDHVPLYRLVGLASSTTFFSIACANFSSRGIRFCSFLFLGLDGYEVVYDCQPLQMCPSA